MPLKTKNNLAKSITKNSKLPVLHKGSSKKQILSIIIPVFNEHDALPLLFTAIYELDKTLLGDKDLKDFELELVFINDGSTDQTGLILEDFIKKQKSNKKKRKLHATLINFARNFGKEMAVTAGLKTCRGQAGVIIDADGQHPTDLIPKMLHYYLQGYDDVYGKRAKRHGEGFIKRLTSWIFYRVLNAFAEVKLVSQVGDFRLLSRPVIDTINQISEHNRYNKEIFEWVGFKKKEIIYEAAPRAAGKASQSPIKLINLAINGLTAVSMSPLRILFLIGVLSTTLSVVFLIFTALSAWVWHAPSGYLTIVSLITFSGGIQLAAIGVIAEYIGKIYHETRGRPVYIVQEIKQTD